MRQRANLGAMAYSAADDLLFESNDEIGRSVDKISGGRKTFNEEQDVRLDDDDKFADLMENSDVQLLKRMVLNERAAPEILPFDLNVVDQMILIVQNQQVDIPP